jgi:exodeoxyribonuclease-3
MTYNILDGGLTLGGRLDRVIQVVRQAKPDLLVLNECNGFDADGYRTLYRLEADLAMRGLIAQARSGFHVTVFVRNMRVVECHPMTDWFHHAALRAKLVYAGGELTLLGTHLCPFSAEARVREAQYLASYVREEQVILMGDLNAISPRDQARATVDRMTPHRRSRQLLAGTDVVDTRALAVLESAGLVDLWRRQHPEKSGFTLPTPLVERTPQPILRFDYILATPKLAGAVRSIRVVENDTTRSTSDHFPVVADLAL